MSEEDKAAYTKIAAELRTMSRRLAELAEAGYADMEGADGPEFFISEELWGLGDDARRVAAAAAQIETQLGN